MTDRTILGSGGGRDDESIDCLTNDPNEITGRVIESAVGVRLAGIAIGLYRDRDMDGVLDRGRDPLLSTAVTDDEGTIRFVTASTGDFLLNPITVADHQSATSTTISGFGSFADVTLSARWSTSNADDPALPDHVDLEPAYPNPFNPTAHFGYSVPTPAHVRISVHDLLGRQVAILVDENHAAGRYETSLEAGTLRSGLYIIRMMVGSEMRTRSVALVK